MGYCLHFSLNFHNLLGLAVSPAGGAVSSDRWGRHGLHFPHGPQGGAEPPPLTYSACAFPADSALSAAERSCSFSGTAGAAAGTLGSASLPTGARSPQDSLEFRLQDNVGLRPRWRELGFLRTQATPADKVRRRWGKVGRSFVGATDGWGGPSSCDPEGLGVQSWVFGQAGARWSRVGCGVCSLPRTVFRGAALPLGVSVAPSSWINGAPVRGGLWALRPVPLACAPVLSPFRTVLVAVASRWSVRSGSEVPPARAPSSGSPWLFRVLCGSTRALGGFALFLWKIPWRFGRACAHRAPLWVEGVF